MAFTPEQLAEALREVGAFIEKRRPPAAIRSELDLKAEVDNSTIEISEVRPVWDNPSEIRAYPFAKIRWYASRAEWALYWKKRDLKWHEYQPSRTHGSLKSALAEIERDPHGCFFG